MMFTVRDDQPRSAHFSCEGWVQHSDALIASVPLPGGSVSFITARDALSSVCRDFWRIGGAFVLAIGITILAAAAVKQHYVSEATLLVLLSPDYATQTVAGAQATAPGMLERETFLKSEIEILTSQSLEAEAVGRIGAARLYPDLFATPSLPHRILRGVAAMAHDAAVALGLAADRPQPSPESQAVEAFSEHFDAAADKTGNILKVSFRGSDAALAADSVNTMIALYLDKRASLYRDLQSQGLSVQVETARKALDEAKAQVASFKTKNSIVNYTTQRELLLRQRDDLTRDVQAADAAAAQAEQSAAAASAQLARTSSDVVLSDETDARHKAEMALVEASSLPTTVKRERNTTYDNLSLDRARAAIGLQTAHARHDADMRQLQTVQDATTHLEANAVELDHLESTRIQLEQNYGSASKALADRLLLEDVQARDASNVRVIQPAEAPLKPTNLRLVIIAAGTMLSIAIAALTAVASNLLRRGYSSPEALEQRLGIPVLASVPELAYLDGEAVRQQLANG